MKAYKKMFLTYIDKYKDLNFNVLSRELSIPVSVYDFYLMSSYSFFGEKYEKKKSIWID